MKKIVKVFLFAAVFSLFYVFFVSADTVDTPQDRPRNVYEENGVTYFALQDKNGDWYYSVKRLDTAPKWLDSYEVRREIDGIPVKSVDTIYSIRKLILHNNIERIEDYAFRETGLEEICIPDSVKYIGETAFWQSGLKKITIGNGIPILKNNIFWGCFHLNEVIIKDGVKEIRRGFFSWDDNIKKITLPPSVTYIEPNSFNHCLKNVTVYGYKNSYAETWAKALGYPFESVGTVELAQNTLLSIAEPQVKGNQMTISVKKNTESICDGYCYEIIEIIRYHDEDFDTYYTSKGKSYRIHTTKNEPVCFKYLPSGSYYIHCREYFQKGTKKEYGPWSLPASVKIKTKLCNPPQFIKAKVTKDSKNRRNLKIKVKSNSKSSYDCVLGNTTYSSKLYECSMWLGPYKSVLEKKPSDYVFVKKNLTDTEVTFKNIKPGTYYFSSHAFNRPNKEKNFGEWSVPVRIVVK